MTTYRFLSLPKGTESLCETIALLSKKDRISDLFFFNEDRSITSSPLKQTGTSSWRFLMSEELLASTGQLVAVFHCNHNTARLLRLLTVDSASEDDKSYRELLHCWSSLNRKPWAALRPPVQRRNRKLTPKAKAKQDSSKTSGRNEQDKPTVWVYLENRVLGNCFQWTEVSNYPQTSARVPTIEACIWSGVDAGWRVGLLPQQPWHV